MWPVRDDVVAEESIICLLRERMEEEGKVGRKDCIACGVMCWVVLVAYFLLLASIYTYNKEIPMCLCALKSHYWKDFDNTKCIKSLFLLLLHYLINLDRKISHLYKYRLGVT